MGADRLERNRVGLARRASGDYALHLLGGFQLLHDRRAIDTVPSSQRLLAFLALNDHLVPRVIVASKLWPDTTEAKASANLRTALWRVNADTDDDLVDVTASHVSLHPAVWVDVRTVGEAARNHRRYGEVPGADLLDTVGGELLPGFSAPWVDLERERLRIELVHLIEVLGRHAVERGDGHVAVLAGLAAIRCDPYHEASHELLIHGYIANGNRPDAMLAFRRYRSMLQSEFGIAPSATFCGGLRLS